MIVFLDVEAVDAILEEQSEEDVVCVRRQPNCLGCHRVLVPDEELDAVLDV